MRLIPSNHYSSWYFHIPLFFDCELVQKKGGIGRRLALIGEMSLWNLLVLLLNHSLKFNCLILCINQKLTDTPLILHGYFKGILVIYPSISNTTNSSLIPLLMQNSFYLISLLICNSCRTPIDCLLNDHIWIQWNNVILTFQQFHQLSFFLWNLTWRVTVFHSV